MIILAVLIAISLLAVAATFRTVIADGYRRIARRQLG